MFVGCKNAPLVQGDYPSPGRGQAIAPTMDEPEKPMEQGVGVDAARVTPTFHVGAAWGAGLCTPELMLQWDKE